MKKMLGYIFDQIGYRRRLREVRREVPGFDELNAKTKLAAAMEILLQGKIIDEPIPEGADEDLELTIRKGNYTRRMALIDGDPLCRRLAADAERYAEETSRDYKKTVRNLNKHRIS